MPVSAESKSMSRVEESLNVTAETVQDTPFDPLVEDVDGDGESLDDLLLTILFSETSDECLHLSVGNVGTKRS